MQLVNPGAAVINRWLIDLKLYPARVGKEKTETNQNFGLSAESAAVKDRRRCKA